MCIYPNYLTLSLHTHQGWVGTHLCHSNLYQGNKLRWFVTTWSWVVLLKCRIHWKTWLCQSWQSLFYISKKKEINLHLIKTDLQYKEWAVELWLTWKADVKYLKRTVPCIIQWGINLQKHNVGKICKPQGINPKDFWCI